MNEVFTLHEGTVPLLVSMPHIGTEIPAELRDGYQAQALDVEDTDWHLHQLYNFLPLLGASVLRPRYSRYVIDLNRPPDDAPMYAGASNTELSPRAFSAARRFTRRAMSLRLKSVRGGAKPIGSPTIRPWPPSWRA